MRSHVHRASFFALTLLSACSNPWSPPNAQGAGSGGSGSLSAPSTMGGAGAVAGAGGSQSGTPASAATSTGGTGAAGASASANAPAAGAGGGASGAGGSAPAATGGSGAQSPDAGAGAAGGDAPGVHSSACGDDLQLNRYPFGCAFAWGANGNDGGRDSYLDFITTWVGYEWMQNRTQECDGCKLAAQLASKQAVAVYYAYFIGSALPDCNVKPEGPNLCTDGARYIRDNRQRILDIYGWYAEQTQRASPDKGVVWLLEGDFMQYAEAETQGAAALSMEELGALARDISCAIRAKEPNARVAVNHITWNSDEETDAYWQAMPLDAIDFVWTTGVGNNAGFFSADTQASSYNGRTATYDYVHMLTGKPIWVDTSFGLSQQADSWTSTAVADLEARIAEGVFAVNVTMPPADYETRLSSLRSALSPVCE